ncbi:ABC-type branched-subunit amino acid transport system substrate-binding protein [Rubricella aquisinus]|uniref:ABC-type branched-subunit amino acid transport system substrate-binding protein n=1 Tax=Rubricella aquisinus TaxID=2028108 RepID=A0A840WGQ7_9RHOB|nr:penicillin-binding protein activator [Rubricella aquisinus]MBB5514318.1 ABC-type branched-subunit amino acid transport system substrate-binding protein [Rubricella aquisinus]
MPLIASFGQRGMTPALAALALTFGLAACSVPSVPSQSAQPAPVAPVVETVPGQFNASAPVRIALLAPYGTGDADREARAQSIENAARLAVRDIQGATIDLVTYGTAENPETAADAARRAIADGAQMIVGPVFSSSVAAVQPIAAAANIPVLSLSNNTEVAGNGAYVLGVTFEDTARRALTEAAERGLRRVGLIHTDDLEGRVARDGVRAAAVQTGTQVVATASYPRSQQGIPASAEAYVNAMVSSGAEVVVMNDRDAGLVYASSFLPFYGLDTRDIQLVSLAPLENDAFARERTLRGAWFSVPDPELEELFTLRYSSVYGGEPHSLAGLAYDAVAAAGAMLVDAQQTQDATPFSAEDIQTPLGFAGVNGVFRFTPNGHIERGLTLMRVTDTTPEVVSPAPGRFGVIGS